MTWGTPCEVAERIFTFPGAATGKLCDDIIAMLSKSESQAARVTDSVGGNAAKLVVDPSFRRAKIWKFSAAGSLTRQVSRLFHRTATKIVQPLGTLGYSIDDPQFTMYPQGGFFNPHTDSGPLYRNRWFTMILYLNESFSGGETNFPDLDCSAVPRAGSVVVFPSHYLHASLPIRKGQKYICVTWILRDTLNIWP
jgi:predicted 2-oxoglutarate/Fe(II)-dependent dioxygenase YbiX